MNQVSILAVLFSLKALSGVLGVKIDNGDVICDAVSKCEIICNYGFIPSGSFIVDDDQIEGNVTVCFPSHFLILK